MDTYTTPPEPEPPKPLVTRERLTAEDIAKINRALEAMLGDRKNAAELLGMSLNRINAAIENHPALSARWKTTNALLDGNTKADLSPMANRRAPVPLALSPADRIAVELTVSEKKMSKSLAKLGFNHKEIEAISSVEEFAGQHFKDTLSIMHGGLLKSAMRLMMLSERIERTYLQDDKLSEKDRRYWWDIYFRTLEKLRDFNEQTNKAALTKALVELKEKEAAGGGMKNTKPNFAPLSAMQVNITGAKDVKVTTPNDSNESD